MYIFGYCRIYLECDKPHGGGGRPIPRTPAEIRLYAATCMDVTRSQHVLRFGGTDFGEV